MSIGPSCATNLGDIDLTLPAAKVDSGVENLVQSIAADIAVAGADFSYPSGFVGSIPGVNFPSVSIPFVGALPFPPVPATPNATGAFPLPPDQPVVTTLATITFADPPTFTDSPPVLLDVTVPDPLSAVAPGVPTVETVITPDSPDFIIPDVPTLASINLPAAPQLDLPLFTDTLDDPPDAPGNTFTYGEVAYTTSLLTEMNTRLLDFVSGASTGLTAAVESAIWNRGRDREALLVKRAVDDATQLYASRGFILPPGVLLQLTQQALQESQDRDSTLSRDVMVKQAELEQSNFHFAFQTAMQLENRLIEHFDSVQARSLDAAKFAMSVVIQLFNARISLYQAEVQGFAAKAQVFETRLKAALAQLDIYRAELEGARIISEINRNQVEIFRAQIEGLNATVNVYRAQIEAAQARVAVIRARVDLYRGEVEAFGELVRAKTAEYQGYATQVQAQEVRERVFAEQVGAYKTRVDAYSALVNAKLQEQTLNFRQLQEFPVELYKARVQGFAAAVQGEAERLKAIIGVYDGQIRGYAATTSGLAQESTAIAEGARAMGQNALGLAQVAVSVSEANARNALASAEITAASIRAAGQVVGQVKAAGLAARSVHASVQASTSSSTSDVAHRSVAKSQSTSNNNNCTQFTTHKD